MTDLHTHILPGVDDGAKTMQDTFEMLAAQAAQGVDTVVLTPHFYPEREPIETFLSRREEAWDRLHEQIERLPSAEKKRLPALIKGAEVAYIPGLYEADILSELTIGNTKNLLLELPFYPWDNKIVEQLYVFLERSGVTPVLAHIERYLACQPKALVEEVIVLGLPVQIGTETIGRMFSPAMRLLRQGKAHLIASDCHNLQNRRPNLGQALQIIEKKLGIEICEELCELADLLAGKEEELS